MPYIVVSTIEKGKSVLTAVPSDWEKEGLLFWPRLTSLKVEKLRRNEYSKPEEDWVVLNCIVKRRHLSSFESAELEIENMCGHSDTETENEKLSTTEKKRQIPSTFERIIEECVIENDATPCFNNTSNASQVIGIKHQLKPQLFVPQELHGVLPNIQIEESLLANNLTDTFSTPNLTDKLPRARQLIEIQHRFKPQVASVSQELQEVTQIKDNLLMHNEIITKINDLAEKVTTVASNQGVLQENINVVLENQKLLFESQQNMMLNLSETITQFEEFMKKSPGATNETENVDFQLIQKNEHLRCLEQVLQNTDKQVEIKKKLSAICGKGKGRGINNAYALIDAMFDRNFLKECSWAGGSRTTESKVCFKSFTKIIQLFFDLVHDSDNSFTLTECHAFIKNVLKNSNQRCNSKKLRKSATKQRPKIKQNVKAGASTMSTVLMEIDKVKPNEEAPSVPPYPAVASQSKDVTNTNSVVYGDVAEIFV